MEIREKKTKWEKHYIATTTLTVKGKPFRVTQWRSDPEKPYYTWRLTRPQMRRILEITEPSDWLFKNVGHHCLDGWEYGDNVFRPATKETIDWLLKCCLHSDNDRCEFNTEDKDIYGNHRDKGAFELWNVATHHYVLKPSSDFIKIDI